MLSSSLVAAFLMAGISGFFSPGLNNIMLMTSSAKFGLAPTLPHAGGVVLGFALMVFLVGLGLAELFATYPLINTVMRYAAAAYFLWMAWTMLGIRVGKATGDERPMRFHEAALFQWINPKAWAMAASFAALFVQPGEARIPSLLLLTAGCALIAPFSCAVWMVFGQGLVAFLRRTDTERFLGVILAALMAGSAVLFLI